MPFSDEKFSALQTQVQEQQNILQQILELQQQQQGSHNEPFDSEGLNISGAEIFNQETPLHSLPVRADHAWTPVPLLSEFLSQNSSLFVDGLMTNTDHSTLIDMYPPIKGVRYTPPQTIPAAFEKMSSHQKNTDSILKHHQYVLSAVFRPLDVLASEISKDQSNPNIDRYLTMLKHTRQLLVHSMNTLTQSRKNVAFKAINRTFQAPEIVSDEQYIMPPEEFQNSVTKQHAVSKSIHEAQKFYKNKQRTNNSSGALGQNPSFFRPGLSSQHDGSAYNNNRSSSNIVVQPTTHQKHLTTTTTRPPLASRGLSQSVFFRMDPNFKQLLASQYHTIRVQNSFSQPPTFISQTETNNTTYCRPNSTTSTNNYRSPQQIRHRDSRSLHTRIQLLNLCDSQKEQWSQTRFQSEKSQSVCYNSTFQNGNIERSIITNKTPGLSNIHRSIRCILHIPVHPQFRKYLRFQWNNVTYQYKTTPFGLSVAPWIFTKICRPILTWVW